jgi:hypothetical protein
MNRLQIRALSVSGIKGQWQRRALLGMVAILGLTSSHARADNSLGDLSATILGNTAVSNYTTYDQYDYTTDGSLATTSTSLNFTGLDGSGAPQTMVFTGSSGASALYGSLHSYASGTVTNTYYNASNPVYYNSNTNVTDPAGSPDYLESLGRANFVDTLSYGGTFASQYYASYIFHIDGTNSGDGSAFGDLSVAIAGNTAEQFIFSNGGDISEDVATKMYPINAATPQDVEVYLQTQFVADTQDVPDGSTLSAESDFSDTVTLSEILVTDAQGVPVSGITFSSASGTSYPASVPEPASIAGMFPLALWINARRRQPRTQNA